MLSVALRGPAARFRVYSGLPQFNCMTYARRGVSLEQRTHRTVMFQSFLLLDTSFATVEDAAHRTDARKCAPRHRPVAFATEACALSCASPSTAEPGFILGFGIRDILHPVFPCGAASQYWTKVQYTGFRFFDRKNSLQSVGISRWDE